MADVHEAAQVAGRAPDSVKIIGVTKYVDVEVTRSLLNSGCMDLGESRPQSLWEKCEAIQQVGLDSPPVRWHLIGHLQRNKVRRTLPLVHLIHSVDSKRLIDQIELDAVALNGRVAILIEVNVTPDQNKTGVSIRDAEELVEYALQMKRIRVEGLMGMASLEGDADQASRDFATLRQLRDNIEVRLQIKLPELSMGMSGDFREAIAEGATLVRIGSALFQGISK